MARNTKPRLKTMRTLGMDLPGLSRKTIERRPYPAGQHGAARRRRPSDYSRQLKEKQKLRFNYGLGERQFRRLMAESRHSKMETGKKLLELLERRLDNVVFRAGFAPTIPAARQLVNHSHFLVNGKKVNIPSYRVKAGDVIELRPKSQKLKVVAESLGALSLTRPEWLDFAAGDAPKATISVMPDYQSVPLDIEVQLIVEYYSRLM